MRKVALAALVGGACFSVACTALLGDFEVAPGAGQGPGGGGPDGGPAQGDGAGPDGPADAGPDAPPAVLLNCTLNPAQARLVDQVPLTTGVTDGFDEFVHVFHVGNSVRIVARRGAGNFGGQKISTLYSFDTSGPSPTQKIDLFPPGSAGANNLVLDARRGLSPPRIVLLEAETQGGGGVQRVA